MSLREKEGRASLFYFFVPVFVRDTEVVVVAALRLLSFPLTAATDQSPPPLLSCGRHWASFKIDGGKATHNRPPPKQHQHSFSFFVCLLFCFRCLLLLRLSLSPPLPRFWHSNTPGKGDEEGLGKGKKSLSSGLAKKEGPGAFLHKLTLSVAVKSTFQGCFF